MMLCRLLEDLDCTLVQGRSDIEVNAICCDSRSVTPGCVFVCLPGQHTDGRRFAHAAAAAGAAVLVFEDTLPNFEFSRSCSPALVQAERRIGNQKVLFLLDVLGVLMMLVMSVGRLASGVHWLTDVLGGVLLGAALTAAYAGVVARLDAAKAAKAD